MMNKKLFLVAALAIIWGANFPVSQFLLKSMDVLTIRYAASIMSLCVYCLLFFPYLSRLKNINKQQLKTIILLSIPSIFTVPLFNLFALKHMDSSAALLLIYTMPAMTSLLVLLMTKSGLKQELWPITLSVVGVLFVIGMPFNLGIGELVILLSALVWAVGGLLNQRYMPQIPLILVSFVQLFFVSASNILVLLLFSQPSLELFTSMALNDYLALLYVGVVGGGLAFHLWFKLIKAYGASVAAYCTLWAPILGLLVIALATDEVISPQLLVGGVFIVLSIYVKNRPKKTIQANITESKSVKSRF